MAARVPASFGIDRLPLQCVPAPHAGEWSGVEMKVLVIGSGGREHALAWKLRQSPQVSEVLVAPGNAGTAHEPGVRNAEVAANDIEGLLKLARDEKIDLTVVGPEVPLVAGVVDRFRAAGLRIFGPRALAARLEGSKSFAKDFLLRHNIPTAGYAVFTELSPALDHVLRHGAPIVIKADGLAAGKGVVVALTVADAELALHDMLGAQRFGDASSSVVIEEFLEGEEASYIVISDGSHALPMASSQDHKRRDEGDLGPNTGGMGAYSPAPVVTPAIEQRILKEVIEPTLRGMAAEGAPFIGFLYAGLMIDKSGTPKVIEFNVRFGDPETQPIMLRLKSDLVELIDAALEGRLQQIQTRWDSRPSIGVVLAAQGYPGKVRTGDVIDGLDANSDNDVKVFHAGTRIDAEGRTVTAGGRVLTVCALGASLAAARENAYAAVGKLHYEGAFCRRDIAHLALRRG
jgi:phosphoribosylamine--glycine ligase